LHRHHVKRFINTPYILAVDELDLIDRVETLLRNKLRLTKCVICGYPVIYYDEFAEEEEWGNKHTPYIEVSGDEIVAGYRCRDDPDNPVIVFRISRSRSGRGGTRVYE
jgi:hypothetical protein